MNSKTRSRKIRAKLPYFPNQVKEMHEREMITPAHPTAPPPFPNFYDANHLYLMKIARTRKNKKITPLQVTNHL